MAGFTTSLTIMRITKRPDFLRANAGQKAASSIAIIRMIASPDAKADTCRVGFTVSSACGNAVVRNRIKRRLRAAVTTLWSTHARAGYDYVIIGKAGSDKAEYQTILDELSKSLRKLHG